MTGGNGPDTFLFRLGFGENIITDYNAHIDALQFDDAIFSDLEDMFDNTTETADGVVIADLPTDTVTLLGVSLAELQSKAASFYFI